MFKVGIFMGWADLSVDGSVPWDTLVPMYTGACMWTLTYETVYQHQVSTYPHTHSLSYLIQNPRSQDKLDDIKIGLNSAALLLGKYTIPFCTMTAIGFISLLTYSGMLNGQGFPFYLSVAIAALDLLSRLLPTDIDRPEDCKNFFLGTVRVGQTILTGLVVDAALKRGGMPLMG
jgi:4-hydroxybenzoate polyprenyltransferase